jgi:hypothetical protein
VATSNLAGRILRNLITGREAAAVDRVGSAGRLTGAH